MARTTSSLVQGILLSDYGPDEEGNLPSLTPFIDTASSIVDDLVDYATSKGVSLGVSKLEIIERWLAAHAYVQSDQAYSYKQTSKAAATFQGKTDLGLMNSKYGQMALTLDSSGYLAAILEGGGIIEVTALWLGKAPSEQTDYLSRD